MGAAAAVAAVAAVVAVDDGSPCKKCFSHVVSSLCKQAFHPWQVSFTSSIALSRKQEEAFMFWIRVIAIYAIILGFQGTSFTDMEAIERLFRWLFILGGALSLFGSQLGIQLLTLTFFLSIPEFTSGSLNWPPVRLARFVLGTGFSGETNFYLGFDWLAMVIVSKLTSQNIAESRTLVSQNSETSNEGREDAQ